MRTIQWILTAFLVATAVPAMAQDVTLEGFGNVKLGASLDQVSKTHKIGRERTKIHPDPSNSTDLDKLKVEAVRAAMLQESYPISDYALSEDVKEQIGGLVFVVNYGVTGDTIQQIKLISNVKNTTPQQCQVHLDRIAGIYAEKYGKFEHAPVEVPTAFPAFTKRETRRSWPDRTLVLTALHKNSNAFCIIWVDYLQGGTGAKSTVGADSTNKI